MSSPRMAIAPARAEPQPHVRRLRVELADGRGTTVHVARHAAATTRVRVALVRGQALADWCAAHDVRDALVGGFFTRPACVPLGELRMRGIRRRSVPFDAPWGDLRACVHISGDAVAIAARDALPARPPGDLLQAGPLLVRDGAAVYDRADDREGFSAGSAQFDSDITAARHPRAALGLADGALLAVACDGRSAAEAGLTLEEWADVLVGLGAHTALNLDGGGSTSLIAGGRLHNRPYADVGVPEPGGRAVATALVFAPA
jgi:hypothetical protein